MAQAWNVPDDAAPQTNADDTAQPWAIQPPVVVVFDPSAGFPWNQTERESWSSWAMDGDAIYGNSWAAPLGFITVVTGGLGPNSGGAYSATPSAIASAFRPGGGGSGPTPGGSASNPKPQR